MTIAGDLAAIRAIARSLSSSRPPDPRRLSAWSSTLQTAARGIERGVQFMLANVESTLPEPDDDGYAGLDASQSATRYASIVQRLALTASTNAGDLLAERDRFVAHFATSAPQSAPAQALGSVDADTVGKTRRDARATSKKAALRVLPGTGSQRRKVLQAVAAVARNPRVVGLTDVEIQRATSMSPNSERPRRVELVEGGWLEPSGQTREHYGAEHTVWVLTARAAGTSDLWVPQASA